MQFFGLATVLQQIQRKLKKENLVGVQENTVSKKEKNRARNAQFFIFKKNSITVGEKIALLTRRAKFQRKFQRHGRCQIKFAKQIKAKNNQAKESMLSLGNLAEVGRGWYLELQLKVSNPLLLSEKNEDYFREKQRGICDYSSWRALTIINWGGFKFVAKCPCICFGKGQHQRQPILVKL